MLLAIDSATRWTGLAIFDGITILAEWGWRCQNTQTMELAPAVSDLLNRVNSSVSSLTALAITGGPGSYTGMRVGLGFAKGLALARQLPIIAIPTLDIVAAGQTANSLPLIAVAEAGRTRLLAGRYHYHPNHGWQATSPAEVQTVAELAASLQEPTLLAGELNGAVQEELQTQSGFAEIASAEANVRRGAVLARLAWARWQAGESDDPATLVPDYLRPPAGA